MRTMPMKWGSSYPNGRDPCAACGRELKPGAARWCVHVIDGGSNVLHPDDEALYTEDAGELGSHHLGPECRKQFGAFARKA